jgi:ABC-type transport system involved in Fe-S cluster assembly fused permease/ATPase subunit
LDEKPTVQDKPNAKSLVIKNGTITFNHIGFSYDIRPPILQDIHFEIPSGKTFAIVGATGSGKSTIAKLLFRYYDVLGGTILIDGQDIRDVTQLSLQKCLGAGAKGYTKPPNIKATLLNAEIANGDITSRDEGRELAFQVNAYGLIELCRY